MEERRQGPRHTGRAASSIFLTAPALAEGPIEPVDFSSGGFRVNVGRLPRLGEAVSCTLHVRGVALSGIPARVAWTREEAGPPRQWTVGLAVTLEEGARVELTAALTGLLAEIKAGS